MFKYYNHLIKIEQSKDYVYDLLRSAFEEDKQLHSQNCPSWGKSVKQLKSIFNLDALDLSHVQLNQSKQNKYADPGYNDVWVIHDGNAPYWCTHYFLIGHIKF
jgi:hypothetical protein